MKQPNKRRNFVKNTALLSLGLPLLGTGVISCKSETKSAIATPNKIPKSLRILLLGGTSFLGPHQIDYALSRGHSVTTFTRGKSKPTVYQDLFDKVEQLIGDRENDLTALEKGTWDVVVDNSGHKAEWTKKTATLLKDRVERYVYISSTGVYYPYLGKDITESTKALTTMPEGIEDEGIKMEYAYGVMKANSEINTKDVFGEDRSLIVRPTYMMGPADKSDRFIYWPIRLSKGGEVMIPGKPEDPVQYIDVRDVAEWTIRSIEEKKTGTFNVVGPKEAQTMPEFVRQAQSVFDVESTFVQVDDYEFLKENVVPHIVPWILPEGDNYGSARVDNQKALESGLTFIALQDSIKDTLQWWNSDSLTNKRRNEFEQKEGSIFLREKEVLEKWKAR